MDEKKEHDQRVNPEFVNVRWLMRFNEKDPGWEQDVPVSKAVFWSERGMVEIIVDEKPEVEEKEEDKEEVKEKKVKAAPKDKVVRGSADK